MRARWVLPIASAPIEHGEVVIEGDRIVAVRPATGSLQQDGEDFGDAILMPGLVNVHTHLDYTLMRGLLEDIPFFPWIRELTARKAVLTQEDWIASATWGAAEAVAGGVTTIGDCTDSGAALIGAKRLGLGGIVFQEVFGIDERQTVVEIVEELNAKLERHRLETPGTRIAVGISPHAPYTVRPELMRALGRYADANALPVCIHAAESTAEGTLFRSGAGPIAEMFRRREIVWQAPGGSVVEYLEAQGVLSARTLLVHGVQVSAEDRVRMRRTGAAWAHCPKSNAKLGNGVAPLEILRDLPSPAGETECGVRVGIGSDSVASNNTMDLFEEMRFAVLMQRGARRRIEALSAQAAVEMATRGGAEALGMAAEIGTLEVGKRADICVVGLDGLHNVPAYHPYNALVYAARAADVLCTLIGGQTRYDRRFGTGWEHRFPNFDLTSVRLAVETAAKKMRQWRPEPQ
ncbi:MAG: Cytosine deaminase and related metal-dependent hydrolase [Chthonomonadaceae bacterium]|nr:Cytosine deaminase and related metal-dependent hydrolase [Chthonomonadaceae bacterium]